MQIFGRRPRQKRGSRCVVLLLPLLVIFIVLLVLTVIRFPRFDTRTKITNACITGFVGLVCLLVSLLLYRRTRRFYVLGKSASFPCAAIRLKGTRYGKDTGIEFFSADPQAVRAYLVADDCCFGTSDDPALSETQKDKLFDRYIELCSEMGKIYSYQEFLPFDLAALQNKKIFCEKRLFQQIFGASGSKPSVMNGNEFYLYEPEAEWPSIKEKLLNCDSNKGL